MAAGARILDLLLGPPLSHSARERSSGSIDTPGVRVFISERDMAMAPPPTSTASPAATPTADLSGLGGIEALNLKVGPVRRNLFGPVDHAQLQQDFQRLLSMSVEVATKRWSFDFQSDQPTPGAAMEWEELHCQDVPAFYRSCTVRRSVKAKTARRSSSSSSSGEGSPASSSPSGSGDEYFEVTTRGSYRAQSPSKRRQANITDFFHVKKRRLMHYKGSSRQ